MRFTEPLESRNLFADFSVAFTSTTIPASAAAGDKLKAPSATFTVSESGDLTKTQGKAKLTLGVAINSGNVIIATAKDVKITASQLAKKPKTVKAAFSKLKVAPDAGTYTLVASLRGDLTTAGDSDATNNSASANLTIAASSTTGGGTGGGTGTTAAHPWPNSQLGNTLIFRDDTGGIIPGQNGSFYDYDTPANIGTFHILPTGKNNFFLDFTAEAGNEITGTIDSSAQFAGHAVQFGVDKTQAQGFLTITQVGSAKANIRLYYRFV